MVHSLPQYILEYTAWTLDYPPLSEGRLVNSLCSVNLGGKSKFCDFRPFAFHSSEGREKKIMGQLFQIHPLTSQHTLYSFTIFHLLKFAVIVS